MIDAINEFLSAAGRVEYYTRDEMVTWANYYQKVARQYWEMSKIPMQERSKYQDGLQDMYVSSAEHAYAKSRSFLSKLIAGQHNVVKFYT